MIAITIALTTLVPLRSARANDATELEKGRLLYEDGKHAEAETFLGRAIDGITPTIVEPKLVIEGRMIRAASDLYLGRKADAIVQFEQILRVDATFEPDAIAFPPGVLDEFRRTRDRLARDADAKTKSDALAADLKKTRLEYDALHARFDALRAIAADERIITKSSRLVAAIPFGVGQFENGDTTLGIILAATETAALVTASISYGIHESIPHTVASGDGATAERDERDSRYTNLVSSGAFAALAIFGIIEAEVSFVPETVTTKKRELPKDLASVMPMVSFGAGGASVGVIVRF